MGRSRKVICEKQEIHNKTLQFKEAKITPDQLSALACSATKRTKLYSKPFMSSSLAFPSARCTQKVRGWAGRFKPSPWWYPGLHACRTWH